MEKVISYLVKNGFEIEYGSVYNVFKLLQTLDEGYVCYINDPDVIVETHNLLYIKGDIGVFFNSNNSNVLIAYDKFGVGVDCNITKFKELDLDNIKSLNVFIKEITDIKNK